MRLTESQKERIKTEVYSALRDGQHYGKEKGKEKFCLHYTNNIVQIVEEEPGEKKEEPWVILNDLVNDTMSGEFRGAMSYHPYLVRLQKAYGVGTSEEKPRRIEPLTLVHCEPKTLQFIPSEMIEKLNELIEAHNNRLGL